MTFSDFARCNGLRIDNLYASDKIQRCSTESHPHKKNAAYFWDGLKGFIFDWAGDARTLWFNAPNANPWTDAEKRAYGLRNAQQSANKDKDYALAACKAKTMLSNAELTAHSYLEYKGFDIKGFVLGNELLIPMRDFKTNNLQTLQRIFLINNEFEKKMLSGGKAKGAVHVLGNRSASELIFCEGYATGLSIKLAADSVGLNMAVVVCFSAGNMTYVARGMSGIRYIYADYDKSFAGENAAIATGLPYIMSDTLGNDANDDQKQNGIFYVAQKLMEVRLK